MLITYITKKEMLLLSLLMKLINRTTLTLNFYFDKYKTETCLELMGKRELIALLNLSSWCLVMVERLFLAVPRGSLQFVNVVFPDHTHLLFLVGKADPCFVSIAYISK